MLHKGFGNNECGISLDNLSILYSGNQIDLVSELGDKTKGFIQQPNSWVADYRYDANGNLTEDPKRAYKATFNYLNHPTEYDFNNNDKIAILYTAEGQKLTKTVSGSQTYTKDYCKGIEYKDSDLEAVYHDEGRVVPTGAGSFQFEYFIRDHLGNNRVVFTDLDNDGKIEVDPTSGNSEVLEENHYYPFGALMQGDWNTTQEPKSNPYVYNSKEIVTDYGLDEMDFGNRRYYAWLPHFDGVDPISERFSHLSTYNYADNSPIANVDLHGLQAVGFGFALQAAQKRKQGGQEAVGKHYQGVQNGTGGAIATGSLFLPGPEDAVVGAIAATRFGGAILKGLSKFADEAVESVGGLFRGNKKGLDDLEFNETELAVDGNIVKGGSFYRKGKPDDFELGHDLKTIEDSRTYKDVIKNMSDEELIKSLEPDHPVWGTITVKRGVLLRGNNRIYELQKRKLNIEFKYEEKLDDNADYFYDYEY